MNEQPDWLKKAVGGLDTAHRYTVFIDGNKFAIIKCPGYTGYVDRMSGHQYVPVHYKLIEKGYGFWQHRQKDVWEGRITGHVIEDFKFLLNEYETGHLKFKD